MVENWSEIFQYPHWISVLNEFSLPQLDVGRGMVDTEWVSLSMTYAIEAYDTLHLQENMEALYKASLKEDRP